MEIIGCPYSVRHKMKSINRKTELHEEISDSSENENILGVKILVGK